MLTFLSTACNRRSFGTMMMVSTFSFKYSIPELALRIRTVPSNINGLVTTATVNAPISFAHSATIGAPPVPVPPPIPAVTKTMSAPCNAFMISSLLSSAAASPISGFAPAPRPLVSFSPNCNFFSAFDVSKIWTSVLAARKSTPCTLASIIRFTALLPAPPTPITLIFAKSPI